MSKREAIDCLRALPDTATWDEILYSLYVMQKVEKGRQEARDGKGLTIEEARKRLGVV